MDLHEYPEHCAAAEPAGSPFTVSVDVRSAEVSVAGELDREHAHHVLDALAALSATDHAVWTLEARQVTFCDAAGLRSLVTAHRLAHRHGRELSVLPSTCMHRLVLLVGLEQLLHTPPAPARLVTDVAECRRAHTSLATVRELRHPAGRPAPTDPAPAESAVG
ncbi:STAS domain-containing protein [Blastococcus saxobsidens]|uniref:Anti-anti-sigma regulatory factor (Antagonist of anti-sigma factor) (Modular protein) n=1 Tax=Blastococcus saxobsidens (strain DD2) TaxID=1146883 RepID=H6RMH8_BLASD|nr:STAS domain-containing protein [Blastococcus saxobsidens]CCG03813.1 Anti-anti-sigma regulatory factor (Antagonist of anti-sigma factor) (modular protein) [Blastococcus saxobsidens DD2]